MNHIKIKKYLICMKKNFKHLKKKNHCHFIGKYRDTAQDLCNLRKAIPGEVHVIIHSKSNYEFFLDYDKVK